MFPCLGHHNPRNLFRRSRDFATNLLLSRARESLLSLLSLPLLTGVDEIGAFSRRLVGLLLPFLAAAFSSPRTPRLEEPTGKKGCGRGARPAAMDGWLIRKSPKEEAGGRGQRTGKAPRDKARGQAPGNSPAGRQRARVGTSTPSSRTGSSFATCPVCGRTVPLALLQSVHMDSPECAPVREGAALDFERAADAGGAARDRGDAGNADEEREDQDQTCRLPIPSAGSAAARKDEPTLSSPSSRSLAPVSAQRQWWTQEEQKRRRVEQPLTGSWWEPKPGKAAGAELKDDPVAAHAKVLTDGAAGDFSLQPKLQPRAILEVPGLFQFADFITEGEETSILAALDEQGKQRWKKSMFNGECHSQGWGVRYVCLEVGMVDT